MTGQGFLIEKAKFVNAIAPVNATGAAQASGWIGLKFGQRLCFVVLGGAWAGGTPAVTLQQAQDASGTGAKALAFGRYFQFNGTPADLPAETAVSGNTYNLANAANQLNVIEVASQDLDQNNGFGYVQLNVASPGANNDYLAAAALVYDLPHSGKPATLPSVLV